MSRRTRSVGGEKVELVDALVAAGMSKTSAERVTRLPFRSIELAPKRPFRQPGDSPDQALFVRAGILAKFKPGSNGRRQIVSLRFAGEGILPRAHPADYGLQAIVPTEVLALERTVFDQALIDVPELARLCLQQTQRHCAIGQTWLANRASQESARRVAHLLCEAAVRSRMPDDDPSFRNPFTQIQIAEITGQTSVNVNRVFADFERLGLMKRQAHEITISDWAEFRRFAGFDARYLQ